MRTPEGFEEWDGDELDSEGVDDLVRAVVVEGSPLAQSGNLVVWRDEEQDKDDEDIFICKTLFFAKVKDIQKFLKKKP